MAAITSCNPQASTARTSDATKSKSNTTIKRRVSFKPQVQKVVYFEPVNCLMAKELFYQPQDYSRFRADFQLDRARTLRMERIERLNKMTQQARQELLMKTTSMALKLSSADYHLAFASDRKAPAPQFRPALASQGRGCALMA